MRHSAGFYQDIFFRDANECKVAGHCSLRVIVTDRPLDGSTEFNLITLSGCALPVVLLRQVSGLKMESFQSKIRLGTQGVAFTGIISLK